MSPGFPLRKVWRVSGGEFDHALRTRFRDEITQSATSALRIDDPNSSAWRVLTLSQALLFSGGLLAVAAAFALHPLTTLIVVNAAATAYFIAVIVFRVYLASVALNLLSEEGEPPPLSDVDLPVVTILLPLFREAHALPALIAAMDQLDYPPDKLDIKILLEKSDTETSAEIEQRTLDDRYDVVIVPISIPQTKPKACNYGLSCARGDLVVIYDAEDQPEPDQLRIAAAAFDAGGADLACVQARLSYYNADENWLTRGIMAQTPREGNPSTAYI